jgi:hypothetical protein
MKINFWGKEREYNKELAFDVETFLQANESNFQEDFESSIEWTGISADDPDAYHEFVYWEENDENAKQIISELHFLYLIA